MNFSIIIGTRGSQLALKQTNMVAEALKDANPGLTTEIRILKTKGDRVTDVPLSSFSGEGVFVKELEHALLGDEIHMAVHSLKDMPTAIPDGLTIPCTPERADVRDALISNHTGGIDALPEGAVVGTSSLRRRAQLLSYRPDLTLTDVRGNLDTRLKKLKETNLDAIILAAAGLDRMAWDHHIEQRLPCDICLPAVGQGAIAIETRQDDEDVISIVQKINHESTCLAVRAERAFLRSLGGGCQTPIGAWARLDGDGMHLDGLVADGEGTWVLRDAITGPSEEAESLGEKLATALKEKAEKEGRAIDGGQGE